MDCQTLRPPRSYFSFPEIASVVDCATLGLEKCGSYRIDEAEVTCGCCAGQPFRMPHFWCAYWELVGTIGHHDPSSTLGFESADSTGLTI